MKLGKKLLGTILSLGLAIGGVTAAYTPATVSADTLVVYAPSIYQNYFIGTTKSRGYEVSFTDGYWANHIWMGGKTFYYSCGTGPLASTADPYKRCIYNTVNGRYWYKTNEYWVNERASYAKMDADEMYIKNLGVTSVLPKNFDELVEHGWNFVDYRPLKSKRTGKYEYYTIYVTESGREYIKDVTFLDGQTSPSAASCQTDVFKKAWVQEYWVGAEE